MSNVNLSAGKQRTPSPDAAEFLQLIRQALACEFDNGSRSRRGPKPRQAARQTQAQRILRPLVPRLSSYDQEASQPACVEVEDEPSWATQEMQAAAEPLTLTLDHDSEGENGDDGNDDRSSSPDGSHTSDPDPLQWKSGLESILYEDESIADVLPGLDVYTCTVEDTVTDRRDTVSSIQRDNAPLPHTGRMRVRSEVFYAQGSNRPIC
ncbi:hypothetical protein MY4824_009290 [Beauveria thailandica]